MSSTRTEVLARGAMTFLIILKPVNLAKKEIESKCIKVLFITDK